ncbi:MAG: type II toxin-antitoxin system RelE/ParE family toxin [Bacteroidales bacterium]|nr:type II toxin-antitoxin system RelE/ParE family toxin [Bacteroidales bacterium]
MWTNEALTRLREIKKYIAQDKPERAVLFIKKIIDQAETLASNPHISRVVPEISRPDIRELIFNRYRIVYRIKEESIEILTVFEGHMLFNMDELSN